MTKATVVEAFDPDTALADTEWADHVLPSGTGERVQAVGYVRGILHDSSV